MTHYYKNTPSTTTYNLDEIITGLTSNNSYFKIAKNNYTSASKMFGANINEGISISLGYKYNNIDICNNAIAYRTTNSGNLSIPSWCNKICAVLVGGGGQGQSGGLGNISTNSFTWNTTGNSTILHSQRMNTGSQDQGTANVLTYDSSKTAKNYAITNANKNEFNTGTGKWASRVTYFNGTNVTNTTIKNFFINNIFNYNRNDSNNSGYPQVVQQTHTHNTNNTWYGGSNSNNEDTVYSNYNNTNTNTQTNTNQNTGSSGSGGGGGAFIYLVTNVIPSSNINVSIGSSGTSSSLTIGNTNYTAPGGQTTGAGGIVANTIGKYSASGSSASSTSGGISGLSNSNGYNASNDYGNGGNGGVGVVGGVSTINSGSTGTNGCVVIYYLTN